MSQRAGIVAAWSIFAGLLYFTVCTASLYDDYQPGIEFWRRLFWPGWALLTAAIVLIFVRRHDTAVWIQRFATGALLISLLAVLAIHVWPEVRPPWIQPADRTLLRTVHQALMTPRFSGRSVVVAYSTGLMALMVWCITFAIKRRRP